MSSLFQKRSKRKRSTVAEEEGAVDGNESNNISFSSASNHGSSLGSGINYSQSTSLSSNSINNNSNSLTTTFSDLGLCPPLVATCRKLGFARPTSVQRAIIPQILNPDSGGGGHLLTLSATGSGKTAAFALPLLHILSSDPYGIFALVLTPTRELAKQIQQQILALGSGSGWKISCALIIGGEDATRQALELNKQPNFVVATPGRCAELCRDEFGGGLYKPNFRKVKFVVLDEADRLLSPKSGFERDVAECLLQSTTTTMARNSMGGGEEKRVRRNNCRTLLFSATMTRSLASLEEMASAGVGGKLTLKKVVVREDGSWDDGQVISKKKGEKAAKKKKKSDDCNDDGSGDDEPTTSCEDVGDDIDDEAESGVEEDDNDDDGSTPNIPAGLRQEYIFMPSRVREAYLLCAIRTLMTHGGRGGKKYNNKDGQNGGSGWNHTSGKDVDISDILGSSNNEQDDDDNYDDNGTGSKKSNYPKAQSAIIFVPTCERCAHISGILTELGIHNVALHSLLSQNRRLASLGTFQSQRVRILVATDVASRGLDVPEVDLVINAELPRRAVDYVHRVGRTARAGRRGRAISLVGERDVDLVHEAERISGRALIKCMDITDDMAVRLLGPVAKASRLTKMKLMDIGFDELVQKHRERKRRDRRRREKAEQRARKAVAKIKGKK